MMSVGDEVSTMRSRQFLFLEWNVLGRFNEIFTLCEVGLHFGAVLLVCASLSFDGHHLLTAFPTWKSFGHLLAQVLLLCRSERCRVGRPRR